MYRGLPYHDTQVTPQSSRLRIPRVPSRYVYALCMAMILHANTSTAAMAGTLIPINTQFSWSAPNRCPASGDWTLEDFSLQLSQASADADITAVFKSLCPADNLTGCNPFADVQPTHNSTTAFPQLSTVPLKWYTAPPLNPQDPTLKPHVDSDLKRNTPKHYGYEIYTAGTGFSHHVLGGYHATDAAGNAESSNCNTIFDGDVMGLNGTLTPKFAVFSYARQLLSRSADDGVGIDTETACLATFKIDLFNGLDVPSIGDQAPLVKAWISNDPIQLSELTPGTLAQFEINGSVERVLVGRTGDAPGVFQKSRTDIVPSDVICVRDTARLPRNSARSVIVEQTWLGPGEQESVATLMALKNDPSRQPWILGGGLLAAILAYIRQRASRT
jgi:hypothetical protein